MIGTIFVFKKKIRTQVASQVSLYYIIQRSSHGNPSFRNILKMFVCVVITCNYIYALENTVIINSSQYKSQHTYTNIDVKDLT